MAKPKFLSLDGVRTLVQYFKNQLSEKVDKVDGKTLSDNNFSNEEKIKLAGIESDSQVNIIESISVNGSSQAITNKNVNIAVPLVDASLSHSGQSGDAKATGDAINELQEDIDELNQSISSTATTIRSEIAGKVAAINQSITEVENSIPTAVSELTNDSNYTTKSYVDGEIAGVQSEIPTNVSELINDSNYTAKSYVDDAIADIVQLQADLDENIADLKADLDENVNGLKSALDQLAEDATIQLKGNDHHYYFGGGTNQEIILANSTTTRVFEISDGKSYHIDITGNMAKTIGFANEEFTTEGTIPTATTLTSYTYDFVNTSNYAYLYVYYSTVSGTGDCFVYEKSNLATKAELEQAIGDTEDELTESIDDTNKLMTLLHDNKDYFGYYATFVNGGMSKGVIDNNYKNRVTSDHVFEFNRNITLTPAAGFRYMFFLLVNGSYVNSGFYTDARTIYAGYKFKVLIARITENPTSYVEDIQEFVDALTFTYDNKYQIDQLNDYKVSASNLVTQTIHPSKIVEGKILDANGVEVNGNTTDKLCYFDVEPGKTITIYNLFSDSTRHASGYLNGVYVSTFPAKDTYSSEEQFVCTGIDQIGVSLDYTKYTEAYGVYKDYSVFADTAKTKIANELKYTDAVGNYLPDTIEIGNPANWEGGYIKANGTTITPSDSYKHSNYIQVYGGVDLTLAYIFGAEAKVCHCYDSQKSWIGAIAGHNSTQASQTIKTLKNTKFIRVTIQNSPANFSMVNIEYTTPVDRNYFVSDLVNGWYNQANKSIETLFAKATAKPILTLIDDDTPTVAAVTRYRDACVANGVVGCYAVITKQLESQTGLADLLLSYEQEGFQSLIHCHNQGSCYDTSSPSYNAAEAESDFVQAIHEILPYNFANWRYWCTPFGSCNAELISVAKKWGMKCLIRSGMLDYETTVPHPGGKYQISRMSLNQNDAALTAIESALDSAALVGGWVLITTHMSETGWDSAESQQRFTDMIAYAKNLGFEIKTVAEALEIRDPIYNLYASF